MISSNIVVPTVLSNVAIVEPLAPQDPENTPKLFIFPNPEEERKYIQTTAEVTTTQVIGNNQSNLLEIRHVTDLSEGTISGDLPKTTYNIDLDMIDKTLPWLNRGVLYHQKAPQHRKGHLYHKKIHRIGDTIVENPTSQIPQYRKIAPKPP